MGETSIIRAALGLTAAAALASCSAAPRSPHETGLPTFVSLNPCLDAILEDIAKDEQILALSHYSSDPAASSMDVRQARTFPKTGGTAEEIIALRPDVVLASTFIAPATKAALERAGLRVETFGSPTSVEESVEQIHRLGELTQQQFQASSLARVISMPGWEPVDHKQNAPDPSLLLWQPGQIVAGEASLIAQLIRESGFTSHSAALGLDQADYVTLEDVLRDPPDVLLVAGDSVGQRHPALGELENTLVHIFEPALFFCAGPNIIDARGELSDLRMRFEGPTQ